MTSSPGLRVELQSGRDPVLPGAVRASIGLGTRPQDIVRLVEALAGIATEQRVHHDPRATEVTRHGRVATLERSRS